MELSIRILLAFSHCWVGFASGHLDACGWCELAIELDEFHQTVIGHSILEGQRVTIGGVEGSVFTVRDCVCPGRWEKEEIYKP
jgi:hypothetical protein